MKQGQCSPAWIPNACIAPCQGRGPGGGPARRGGALPGRLAPGGDTPGRAPCATRPRSAWRMPKPITSARWIWWPDISFPDNRPTAPDSPWTRRATQLKAAQETLRLAELGPRKEDIAAAQATLAANEAAVSRASSAICRKANCTPLPTASSRTASWSRATWPRRRTRSSRWRSPIPSGCGPICPRPSSAACRWAHAACVQTDSHPDKRYRAWIGYVSPTRRVHPQVGRDRGGAFQPGVPGPGVRLRGPGRTAPWACPPP